MDGLLRPFRRHQRDPSDFAPMGRAVGSVLGAVGPVGPAPGSPPQPPLPQQPSPLSKEPLPVKEPQADEFHQLQSKGSAWQRPKHRPTESWYQMPLGFGGPCQIAGSDLLGAHRPLLSPAVQRSPPATQQQEQGHLPASLPLMLPSQQQRQQGPLRASMPAMQEQQQQQVLPTRHQRPAPLQTDVMWHANAAASPSLLQAIPESGEVPGWGPAAGAQAERPLQPQQAPAGAANLPPPPSFLRRGSMPTPPGAAAMGSRAGQQQQQEEDRWASQVDSPAGAGGAGLQGSPIRFLSNMSLDCRGQAAAPQQQEPRAVGQPSCGEPRAAPCSDMPADAGNRQETGSAPGQPCGLPRSPLSQQATSGNAASPPSASPTPSRQKAAAAAPPPPPAPRSQAGPRAPPPPPPLHAAAAQLTSVQQQAQVQALPSTGHHRRPPAPPPPPPRAAAAAARPGGQQQQQEIQQQQQQQRRQGPVAPAPPGCSPLSAIKPDELLAAAGRLRRPAQAAVAAPPAPAADARAQGPAGSTPAPAGAAGDAREQLMIAIKNRDFKLRKVDAGPAGPGQTSPAAGAGATIIGRSRPPMAELMRKVAERRAMVEGAGSDSDEDWD